MTFQGHILGIKGKKIWIPLLIILAGVLVFLYYRSHKVTMKRRPVSSPVPRVETMVFTAKDYDVYIHAMGTVQAQRRVVLSSRVSGQIVSTAADFVRGNVVKKGDILLTIDDTDYVLARQKALNALNQAKAELDMERGRQEIAREELRLAEAGGALSLENKNLVLRKPQMQKAQALVQKAETDLQKADLDLARTRIKAPFDALILETRAALGSFVSVQSALAQLVDVSSYQVEAFIPFHQMAKIDQMAKIRLDSSHGSKVRITSFQGKGKWEGKIVGTTGKVADKTRMAGVLIQVNDPLGVNGGAGMGVHASKKNQRQSQHQIQDQDSSRHFLPMLLGDYVRVDIHAQPLKHVYCLPGSAVRDNNTLWIFQDNTLKIISITPVWKDEDKVFIDKGLSPGDRVIISDLPVPVPGMAVQSVN